ncbi:MAG: CoA transferase [Gammaproteobacteria bacterium]|nr:CoA transferase [Gammaproteobacteria bacterium]
MTGALNGYRVIDTSSVVSGPLAAMMLADQGADVIKVETVDAGDTTRTTLNYRAGMSALFANTNRGKRSVALDLKDPRGLAIVLDLVRGADIFIENWRPGAAERLGLGEDDLRQVRPDLIYVSISGYGREGPYSNHRVYDPVIQAYVGMVGTQRNPDTGSIDLLRNIIADKVTSYTTAQAVTSALLARERGQGGQRVDVSMLDSTLAFFWPDGMMQHTMTGEGVEQPFSVSELNRLWRTSDGYIVTLFQSPAEIRGLAAALEHPEWAEDETFLDNAKRFHPDNFQRVMDAVQSAILGYTTEEIVERFSAEDVPVAPVLERDEVFGNPQIQAVQSVIEVQAPGFGSYRQARPGARFSATPHEGPLHAPLHGEHNDEVLGELGYSAETIAELRAAAVIR